MQLTIHTLHKKVPCSIQTNLIQSNNNIRSLIFFFLFSFYTCSSELPAAAVEKAKTCFWAGDRTDCAMTRQGLSWWEDLSLEVGYCLGLCSRQYSKVIFTNLWSPKTSSTTFNIKKVYNAYNRMSSYLSDIQV